MNGINKLKSLVSDFCKEGYIEQEQKDLLIDLGKQYNVPKSKLEDIIKQEINIVKANQLEKLFGVLNQPDAAVRENIVYFPESDRSFPNLLSIGKLKMAINEEISAFAYIPTSNMSGFCLVHNNNSEPLYKLAQNLAIRLALSLPKRKCHFTLIDEENSGLSFSALSGLDEQLYTILDDKKQIETIFEKWNKDATSFIFKEISNKYSDFNSYFKKNKASSNPYQIVLISGFPSKMSKDFIDMFSKLMKHADKAGLFFILITDKKVFKRNKKLFKLLKNHMFIYDNEEKRCHSNSPEIEKWYNDIYKIEIADTIEFSEEVKFKINQDFDPLKYKEKAIDHKGDLWLKESIDKIIIPLKEKNKSDIINLTLSDNSEDIWIFSSSEKERVKIYTELIASLAKDYSPNEMQFLSIGVKDELYQSIYKIPHWNILYAVNKPIYLYGFIEEVEKELKNRSLLFSEASVNNYSEYRKVTDKTLPRKLVIIQNIHEFLSGTSDLFLNQLIEKFNQLITQCNQYGIHLIILSEPNENVLSFDLDYFTYRILINTDIENSKLFANIPENMLDFLNEKDVALLYNNTNKQVDVFEINGLTSKSFEDDITKMNLSYSKNDNFESKLYNADDLVTHNNIRINQKCIADDGTILFNIGKPNWFTEINNYQIKIPKGGKENVLITGKDENALLSIVSSGIIQLAEDIDIIIFDTENLTDKINMSLDNISVFKTDGEILSFLNEIISNDVNPKQNLFGMDNMERQTVCLILNIDNKIGDSSSSEYFKQISYLIQNSEELNIRIFMNTTNDDIFSDAHLGKISKYSFSTKIICKSTKEEMLSSMILIDDKLSIPNNEYHVLIETYQPQSFLSADPVKLYVNSL